MEIQRSRLEKIQNLLNMAGHDPGAWRDVSKLHGMIVVPDEATSTWVLHTIIGGRPQAAHQIRGDWRERLSQGGFGKRLVSRMYKDMRGVRDTAPLSKIEVARLNAVMWWLHHGKGRDGGAFLELEKLESMLKNGKSIPDSGSGD